MALVRVYKDISLRGKSGEMVIIRVRKDVTLIVKWGNGYGEGT